MQSQYLVIDQKSYYATVECVARGLDPMKTNLVVADPDRSANTLPGHNTCYEGTWSKEPLPYPGYTRQYQIYRCPTQDAALY